jgi:hypothetical protein
MAVAPDQEIFQAIAVDVGPGIKDQAPCPAIAAQCGLVRGLDANL